MESEESLAQRVARQQEFLPLIYKTRIVEYFANVIGEIHTLGTLITAFFIYGNHAHSKHGGYTRCQLPRNGFLAAAFAVRRTLDEILIRERAIQTTLKNLFGRKENILTVELIRELGIDGHMVGGVETEDWGRVVRSLGKILQLEPELKIRAGRDEIVDCVLDEEKRLEIREVMLKIKVASADMLAEQ